MRAIFASTYGGPEVLLAGEVARPVLAPDQILVQVAACGVCGHDLLARKGAFPLSRPPFVMGHEIAGVVVEAGPRARGFAVGNRVAQTHRGTCAACRAGRDNVCVSGSGFYGEGLSGGYGDYVVASARNAVVVPRHLQLKVVAVLSCAIGTGYHALRLSGLRVGDRVLVTGASGGVGLHTVKLAALMGLVAIAVTGDATKAPTLREAGAAHVVIPERGAFHREVRELTGGEGVDGVVEIAGRPTYQSSVRALRAGGRMVLVGNVEPGSYDFNPALAILKELDFVGSGHATLEDLRRVVALVAAGRIAPVIAAEFPRDSAADAHRLIEARRTTGRVVLTHALS